MVKKGEKKGNKIEVFCINCGKPFIKLKYNQSSKRTLARRLNTNTCSRVCSSKYADKCNKGGFSPLTPHRAYYEPQEETLSKRQGNSLVDPFSLSEEFPNDYNQ
jgi:hypothetical protein